MATIPVTVVKKDDAAYLVQYVKNGEVLRKIVPWNWVLDDTVEEDLLELGMERPGVDWASLIKEIDIEAFPSKFAAILHKNDVWELKDATPEKIFSALQKTLGVNASKIYKLARERSNEEYV